MKTFSRGPRRFTPSPLAVGLALAFRDLREEGDGNAQDLSDLRL